MTLVEESTRSTKEAVRYFVQPGEGILDRAKSRRHQIIFGRRGSGKSSLLGKIYADQLVARQPSALVDLEAFKGHSYPDVLVSVLIKTFTEFANWVDTAATAPATKTSFWKAFTQKKAAAAKLSRADAERLSARVRTEIAALEVILHAPEEAKTKIADERTKGAAAKVGAAGKIGNDVASFDIGGSYEENDSTNRRVESEYSSRKIESLHRNIMRYKQMFQDIAAASGGDAFLLLDDLYHIRQSDQAEMIDYFHRVAKGSSLWLKIGTIRHRTRWYVAGDPPIGVKLGDDVDQIDLDVTLESYQTTKAFLFRVLEQFSADRGVELGDILADGARDRLVLASGGVARDFLGLFRKAASETQERVLRKETARGDKIGAEDVNRAAGSYYENKTEELKTATASDERAAFMLSVNKIRDFCLDNSETNCFLVEKDLGDEVEHQMGELVDLKFIHHVRSRVTVRSRERRVYDAFMLDLSFYTGERARRGFEMIEFWKAGSDDSLRKPKLILLEDSTKVKAKI